MSATVSEVVASEVVASTSGVASVELEVSTGAVVVFSMLPPIVRLAP
jgi:hypothetical protein